MPYKRCETARTDTAASDDEGLESVCSKVGQQLPLRLIRAIEYQAPQRWMSGRGKPLPYGRRKIVDRHPGVHSKGSVDDFLLRQRCNGLNVVGEKCPIRWFVE
jgi:hypothetical protein